MSKGPEDPVATLLPILDRAETDAANFIPASSEDLSDEQVLVWALFTHCFRVYRGIRILLKERLAQEASVLNRALLETTTRIAYLMSNRDRLEEMRLRILHDSLDELESLAKFEATLKMPLADEAVERTHAQREALDEAFAARGLKPGGLPDLRQMLTGIGKAERYWYFKRASADVHGSVAALGTKMSEQAEDHYLAVLQDDERTTLVIGMAAVDHFMSAVVATGTLLGWRSESELVEYRQPIDDELLELGRRAGLRGLPEEPSSEAP